MLLGTNLVCLGDDLGGLAFFPAETLLELLDPACGIDVSLLTGIERMRSTRDVEFEERVLVAIFPLNRLGRAYGRASQEGKIRVTVLKNNRTVVIRVNVLFHTINLRSSPFRVARISLHRPHTQPPG